MSASDAEAALSLVHQKATDARSKAMEEKEPVCAALPNAGVVVPRAGLRDLSVVPTLFPTHIANLITTIATSARLSLRLSAFFIEAILEASQLSTRLSLGYTRKLLVTAISSARRIYLMSNAAIEGDLLGVLGFGEDKALSLGSDAFLQVLDKYTNLGIYIIHHTFTLAELFAMSGFYLTANAVQSAHFAAQESVALFDSLFGSNESSRALSSIITLVRTELLEDERFMAKDKGKIASLTALTKALTAFACLQSATWKRTEAKLKLRVIHDCTVVEDGVKRSTGDVTAGTPSNFIEAPSAAAPRAASTDEVMERADRAAADGLLGPALGGKIVAPRKGETYEITDEYTESTTITRTFTVQDLEAMGLSFDKHTRSRSAPITAKSHGSAAESTFARIVEEDSEWLDVLSDGQEEGEAIPSIPNGSTSMGSKAFQEAMEHPTANTERIQFVLKTMTNKLLSRKRTVRSVTVVENENPVPSSSKSQSRRAVASIAWLPSDGMRSKVSVAKSNSDSSLDNIASQIRPSESVPESISTTQSTIAESSRTPMKKALSKAKSAFRPLTNRKRVARPASPPRIYIGADSLSTNSAQSVGDPKSPGSLKQPTPPNIVSQTPERAKRARNSMTTVHESIQTSSNRIQSATSTIAPERGSAGAEDQLFPHDSLVRNLHRFMRFSSAAYGQNFLRIFGMGDSEYNFPSTGQHHANSWSFAQHTRIPIDSLLLSSYTESTPLGNQKAPPLIHYVAVDHEWKKVVLTCRGTLGLSDVLIDLTCDYCPIDIEGADPEGEYFVHSGMHQSSLALTTRNSKVHQVLVQALEANPTYGLVVTGHSLGGGVAALLAIACSMPASTFLASKTGDTVHPKISTPFVTSAKSGLPPGRPIHCYAYGPPAVTSLDLANWAKGLIVSVVHGSDVVPTLSLGVLRDLKNVALTLSEEGLVAEEIVGRVIGVYQRKFKFQDDPMQVAPSSDDQVLSDWTMSLIKTMRADMDSDKLYPPGNVYLMEYFDVCQTIHEKSPGPGNGNSVAEKKARRVILKHCESVQERFREPLFTKTMLNDHLPLHYERSTQLLVDGVGRAS